LTQSRLASGKQPAFIEFVMTRKPVVAVFDAKPYDRDNLSVHKEITWNFLDFRMEEKTCSAAAGADAACIFVNDNADARILRSLADAGVRHLALRCAGFNHVDLDAAKEAGITITRVPTYSPNAVAEHTIALLLALNRKIHRAFNRVRELDFSLSGLVGFDLHGKTAGIYGTGKIGRITAEIFRGFGMNVLACDPFPDKEWADRNSIHYGTQEELITRSDVISLHAPLTPETQHIVREETIARMKRGVVIVNVSRGELIKTSDLIAALKSGHVAGVALDVYEEEEGVFFEDLSNEMLHDDELARLLTFPNVLITAHQAFLTHEALNEIARVTAGNVLRVARGEDPLAGSRLA
jgi:D-lactate dehydrogenase